MNHWLAEELTWLTYTERQHAQASYHSLNEFNGFGADWTLTARLVLKLSDWLIATGESLQRRYEKTAPVSPWVNNRKLAR